MEIRSVEFKGETLTFVKVPVIFEEEWDDDPFVRFHIQLIWLRDQLASYWDTGSDVEIREGVRLGDTYEILADIWVEQPTEQLAKDYVVDKMSRRGITNYRIGNGHP